jgi:peroxiredoxin
MMKYVITLFALLALQESRCQSAYEITVTLKPFKNGYLYLAHYYGNKQMLVDSAAINEQHTAVFRGAEPLKGGIYLIAYPKKDGWVEVVIDKEQRFSVSADSADVFGTMRITGSPDNLQFMDYLNFSNRYGREMQELQKKWASAVNKADSAKLQNTLRSKGEELQRYRTTFVQKHPKHLISSVFRLFREPAVPVSINDPVARNRWYRQHYWDSIDLADERLIRTPVFQSKIDRFLDEIVPQVPDSLKPEVDELLFQTRTNEEMRKYVLLHLTDKYINPKYMGQDAVFVHLFTRYYIPGEADKWLTEKTRKFVFDRGYSLMLNVVGEKAANLVMADTSGKTKALYDVQAPYTIVCFWDPTCGHCQTEVPKLDTLYKTKWKAKGVKMVGVMTEGGIEKWKEFIVKYQLKDWLHIHQNESMKTAERNSGRPGFRQLYDVYQTPTLYLLDKEKKILAKKLNYEQLDEFLGHKFNSH